MATIAAIALGVGAISSFAGAVSGNKASKKARDAAREDKKKAKKYLRPEEIQKVTTQLQPKFREAMAMGEGAEFQSKVAGNLSSHGLTGTGVGEALRNASFAIPEIEAFRRALEMGYAIQQQRAAITMGGPPQDYSRENPYLSALVGGARGFFGAGATPQVNGTGQGTPLLFGAGGYVPNLASPSLPTTINPMTSQPYSYKVK